MDFAIEGSALHRPLGFELATGGGTRGPARAPEAPLTIRVERHAPGWAGPAAAGGRFRGAIELPAGRKVFASARGAIEGFRVRLLGVAAGRPFADAPPRGKQADERASAREPLEAVLLTDARVTPDALDRLLREMVQRGFSTLAGRAARGAGDSIVALASGLAGDRDLEPDSPGLKELLAGGVAVAQALVRRLLEESFAPARARVVQVSVGGGRADEEAARIAEALAAEAALRAALAAPARSTSRADGAREQVERARDALRALGHPQATARVVFSPGGEQAALGVDLRRGSCSATRWTAVPASA
jgi:hypothetical protein